MRPFRSSSISLLRILLLFVGVFVIVLLSINFPAVIHSITYRFTHSEDTDNEKLTEQYRNLYGNGTTNSPSATPPEIVGPSVSPTESVLELSIPKLGLTAPILHVPSGDDAVILAALKNGTVLFPGSADPGQQGISVIIGHSSSTFPWTKYSDVFSQLDRLVPNDLIYVTRDGFEYVYRVTESQKGTAQEILDSGISGDLLLSTCWPIGTDKNRIAVAAIQVNLDSSYAP